MKRVISKVFTVCEFVKIIFLQKILGFEYVVKKLFNCNKSNISKILKFYGANIGEKNNFKEGLIIDNANLSSRKNLFSNIKIGNNCYIGKNTFLDLANKITIEDEVVISAKVTILTHEDVGNRVMQKYYKRISAPVKIGKGSWIGANVTILAGVSIAEYCVVAAGSVVKDDIESFSLVAGVPAKVKKMIDKDKKSSLS